MWLKIVGGGGRWCQVLEGTLGALGLIEELKSPCGYRGFGMLQIGVLMCAINYRQFMLQIGVLMCAQL